MSIETWVKRPPGSDETVWDGGATAWDFDFSLIDPSNYLNWVGLTNWDDGGPTWDDGHSVWDVNVVLLAGEKRTKWDGDGHGENWTLRPPGVN
ncbi:hypothetical protein E9232_004892 [Inquilinus ginsengisoli]|uniref:Uncharacterized protein n=1 Tax=Inquilinus ginsengisoli TaxID=363840 RepID=A0ABU1JUP6_9PROT|nr:hypothetical protein [Inquilinus ginsengisoli]MDR6292352.1 hypothetical protein [Inquilinus ginsengisoli]